ncbi:MAG: heavy metal translocating P-type ATPase [Thermovenabulum sp.]|uniref:heavy metal translocating P-type ATPase n=1 Tax=Thermovenabulum sp. TaxID=3100335 RepID=UPI003C7D29AA
MSGGLKKEVVLEGLTCPVCADKIEKKLKEMEGIKNATINLVNQTLTFEINNKEEKESIISEIEKIVKFYEPHVVVKEKKQYKENYFLEDTEKKEILLLTFSLILYLLPFILSISYNFRVIFYISSYILAGKEVIKKSLRNIFKGQIFDENFLMTIATIGAFAIKEFPEGAAVMIFYKIGELLQDIAVKRSRKSISDLMDIRPDYVNLRVGSEVIKVYPEKVKVGDIVIVKPGERIPVDGIVEEGNSFLDTFSITGESVPREAKPGDEVLSGFVNKNGLLVIKVMKEYKESTVLKILDLVENASSKKAYTENFITTFARYYTPFVVFCALLIAVIPPIIYKNTSFSQWLYRALIFLVISCPCALVISIPLGFFGGIGRAAKEGILIKGSNFLEALNNAKFVVFDKTGTLTKGVFEVTKIKSENGFSAGEVLELAAHAESFSNHPVAISILKAYGKEVKKEKIRSFEEIPGYGIKAKVDGRELIVGNIKLMKKEDILYEEKEEGDTKVYVAVDKVYAGFILISDKIKEDSKDAINSLRDLGIKNIIMLTGDSFNSAKKVAESLGIEEYYSDLLPYHKVEKVEELLKRKLRKEKLIFVGDGINDAPVLARSDIGIAMGGLGSDAAIEASDIVLMTDEPSKLVKAIKIARYTKRIVVENIVFSLGVKALILILGAFGSATMWEAVFADVGVALLAVLNSLRVLRTQNI